MQIVEIAFELKDDTERAVLKNLLNDYGFKYYIEPPNKFVSLEDVECQCEGK